MDQDLVQYLDERFNGLIHGLDQRFEGIDRRFEGIDRKFEGLDLKFERIDRKFEGIDHRFDDVNDGSRRLSATAACWWKDFATSCTS